jgi:hypothetical protein
MNRLMLGVFAATLSGCPGGDDIATDAGNADLTNAFVGVWTGDSEMTDVVSGNPSFGPADDLIIRRTGPDKLALTGFCLGGGAAPATVTSPTTFTIDPFACPPFYLRAPPGDPDSCKVVLSISQGSGSLRRHTLTLTTTGSFAGCEARYSLPFFGRYTGAQ